MSYSKYPGAVDDNESMPETVDLVTELKAEVVNRLRDGIIATETTIGANPTDGYATIKDRLDAMQTEIDSGGGGSFTAGGDLTGDDTEQTVSFIRGIEAPDPADAAAGKSPIVTESSFTNPRSVATDGTHVWVTDYEEPKIYVFSVAANQQVDEYDYTVESITGFRNLIVDDTYIYACTWDGNSPALPDSHVVIVNKSDGSVAGYAYVGAGVRAVDVTSDGTNLYVITSTGNPTPTAPEGLQKFSIAGCLGQAQGAKTYDEVIDSVSGGLDGPLRRVDFGGGFVWGASYWGGASDEIIYKITTSPFAVTAKNDTDGLVPAARGGDVVYGLGYVWVTTTGDSGVVQYDPTTLAALSNTTVPADDVYGITIGPDTSGNPNSWIWLVDWDPNAPPQMSVYGINPAGPTHAATIIASPTENRSCDDLTAVGNDIWIPFNAWAGDPAAIIIADASTSTISEPDAILRLEYQTPQSFTAAGDLSGDNTSQTVLGLRNKALANITPSDGQVYVYNSGTGLWTPEAGFDAGGDLTGTSTSQTVNRIRGRYISTSAPSDGQVYAWNAGLNRWAPADAGGGGRADNGASRRAIYQQGFISAEIGSWTYGAYGFGGGRLRGLVFTGDGIWVASYDTSCVGKFDLSDATWSESIGNTWPIANLNTRDLDLATLTPTCTFPVDMAFDGRHVWVACSGTNNIARIESWGDPPSLLDSFPAGGLGHTPARIIFDGVNMFICGGNTLSKYGRASSGDGLGSLTQLGGFSDLVNMIFDGVYLWAIDDGTNQIRKIDGENMTLLASVNLSGDSVQPGTNKLAFDGKNIYVSRSISTGTSLLDIIDVDSDSVTQITLTQAFWNNSGDIVFDGKMVKLFYSHTFPANPTTWVKCFDPVSRRELGHYGTGLSVPKKITKAVSIGPGFIVGYDETDSGAEIVYFLAAEAPRYARTHFFGTNNLVGQSGTFTTGLRMEYPVAPKIGVNQVSVNGISGQVWLRPQVVNSAIIQLTGTPTGSITLMYNGAGPGPFIVHNEATFGANNLSVYIDGKSLTFSPQPATGESVMFFVDHPTSSGRVVRQMKFV